ncbi:replicative DNA helicase [Spirochaetota bacterium]
MAVDRLPPQDIDTEMACLASAILNPEAFYKITEILRAEDFYLNKHRLIFETITELDKKDLPVDLTSIKNKLVDQNNFDKIGGDAALAEIYQSTSTSVNAEYYANRIKEHSLRRKLIEVSSDVIEKCYEKSKETEELMDEVEREIFQVTEMRRSSDLKSIETVLHDTLDDIGQWYETKKAVTGIASGFKDLDERLTGFHDQELIIIASRPGMGKTAFALNILNHIAIKEKKAGLFFSLEMPATQLGLRLLCIETKIDSQKVRTGHIKPEELKELFQAAGRLEKSHIFIDDTPSVNIFEIRAKARRVAQKVPLGMVVVDYLQLISSTSRVDRHLQIAEISRFLKQLSRELSVPVIALSQLNRAVESRVDQRPTLSDLRESGAIEQDADVVLFLYREEKVKPDSERKGIADIIIGKNRNGPIGTVELMFWDKYTKFGNLTMSPSYDEATPGHEIK